MLNTLIGWSIGQNLGAIFDTIRFETSVGAGSQASPTKISKTSADAVRGTEQKGRLTGGQNFFVTSIYSFCEPGKVSVDILPNNNSNNKISIEVFSPKTTPLEIPKLLEVDVSIDFYNSENQSNDVTIALEGFWIPENETPAFTDQANSLFRILNNIDAQTLTTNRLLSSIANLISITNNLLINPTSYTLKELQAFSTTIPTITLGEEKPEVRRICGTGAKPTKEDEEDEE